eukprot:5756774-Prorocentrum_lima.AAC.1
MSSNTSLIVPSEVASSLSFQLTNDAAVAMGASFYIWVTALELHLASLAKAPHSSLASYTGRGHGPSFHLQPLVGAS